MLKALNKVPGDLGQDYIEPSGEIRVHHLDIIRKLSDVWIGVSTGPSVWYPDADKFVPLYHFHKHISTMDRGWMNPMPTWKTTNQLLEVDLDYALAHDDQAIFRLSSQDPNFFRKRPDLTKVEKALIYRPKFEDVLAVGWAEVFWRILRYGGFPGMTPGWLGHAFGVPMDWYGQSPMSPLDRCWTEGRKKGYC